jgi:hypothetical protein
MRISAQYTTEDWKALKFLDQTEWELAVDMFHDRIYSRYVDHIDSLLTRKVSGFAVLSLDCVLVETMQQFREGTRNTPWGKGKQYFVKFLTGTAFSDYFTKTSAERFYYEIRCGLLHQSEAEGSSRIKRGAWPLVELTSNDKSVIVNVPRFHELLKAVIASYEKELLQQESVAVRKAFRTKMNFICRVEGIQV